MYNHHELQSNTNIINQPSNITITNLIVKYHQAMSIVIMKFSLYSIEIFTTSMINVGISLDIVFIFNQSRSHIVDHTDEVWFYQKQMSMGLTYLAKACRDHNLNRSSPTLSSIGVHLPIYSIGPFNISHHKNIQHQVEGSTSTLNLRVYS